MINELQIVEERVLLSRHIHILAAISRLNDESHLIEVDKNRWYRPQAIGITMTGVALVGLRQKVINDDNLYVFRLEKKHEKDDEGNDKKEYHYIPGGKYYAIPLTVKRTNFFGRSWKEEVSLKELVNMASEYNKKQRAANQDTIVAAFMFID